MATPGTLASAGQAVNSVTYTAVDFGYQGPASIPGGWTQITLKNSGKSTHDLMLMKVAAGKTITDVITAIQGPSAPDWVQAFGGVTAEPGGSASYTVNLVPGNYVMLSFQQSGQNQPPDAARGMLEQITVTAPQGQASGASLPQPGAMIGMADYRFVITGTVGSGNQALFLTNSGTETHEAVFLRLKAGKTMDDFRKALQAEESGQQVAPDQLPFDGAPQGTSLSPGVSAYINVNLPPGTYVLACFIPSIKNPGKSHADLGMAQELTVK